MPRSRVRGRALVDSASLSQVVMCLLTLFCVFPTCYQCLIQSFYYKWKAWQIIFHFEKGSTCLCVICIKIYCILYYIHGVVWQAERRTNSSETGNVLGKAQIGLCLAHRKLHAFNKSKRTVRAGHTQSDMWVGLSQLEKFNKLADSDDDR